MSAAESDLLLAVAKALAATAWPSAELDRLIERVEAERAERDEFHRRVSGFFPGRQSP